MTDQLILRGKIGSSDVAEVHLGDDPRGAAVALKLFVQAAGSDPALPAALASMAGRVASLGHPGIVAPQLVGHFDGRLCQVAAYAPGAPLALGLQRLATREVVLPAPTAIWVLAELAHAVGIAHAQGLVHGGLTPRNLILGADGHLRVTDFGVRAACARVPALAAFADRGRKGYLAPELLKGDEQPDPASDVYALGAISYELLCGKPIPDAATRGLGTRRDEVTPPSRIDRRVPARLDPVILRAIETNRGRRFRNAGELERALREVLANAGFSPGVTEAGRFFTELFPNEVALSPIQGPSPWSGPVVVVPLAGAAPARAELRPPPPERTGVTQVESTPRGAVTTLGETPSFTSETTAPGESASGPPALDLAGAAAAALPAFASPAVPANARRPAPQAVAGPRAAAAAAAPASRGPLTVVTAPAAEPEPQAAPRPRPAPARRRDTMIDGEPLASGPDDPTGTLPLPARVVDDSWRPKPPPPAPPPRRRSPLAPFVRVAPWAFGVAVLLAIVAAGRAGMLPGAWRALQERVAAAANGLGSPAAAPPPGARAGATLSVTTDRPVRVYFDGKLLGQTPLAAVPVDAGEHILRLERLNDKRRSRELILDLPAGQVTLVQENAP